LAFRVDNGRWTAAFALSPEFVTEFGSLFILRLLLFKSWFVFFLLIILFPLNLVD